jgi:hypothetical protein
MRWLQCFNCGDRHASRVKWDEAVFVKSRQLMKPLSRSLTSLASLFFARRDCPDPC